ncbi:MAG: hypothetical protein IT366_17525 [Candidatus Hydrogenedentes bacterium]|nr:hypothetical protein [Candidatus Hydrogenedentota bacterium]
MSKPVTIGLLPLYIELYDRVMPQMRPVFAPFLADIEGSFRRNSIEVRRESVCCTKTEVAVAVDRLENAQVDLLVVMHLAYSPSLESVDVLAKTSLPLLLLDTTMDESFGAATHPDRILYNHGIHGLQDLASVLLRRGRAFNVVAGHWKTSQVIDRAASHARSAAAANALRHMRVLRVGETFKGMGDFHVEAAVLRDKLGIDVIQSDTKPITKAAGDISDDAITCELALDRQKYKIEASEEVHRRSVRADLALRKVVQDAGCRACSFNFLAFDKKDGPLCTPPFLGASKLMAEGFGYAGEGDVLTASLVGALNRSYLVNFTEMFCPDWNGNSVFLSHMGEFNPNCADGDVHLVEKDFPFTGALNPAILVGAMKRGPAILVNLAPGPNDSFRLLAAPVEILSDTTCTEMKPIVRGWFRAESDVATFLEWYSQNGGTHHCALVHDAPLESIVHFATYCGIPCVVPPKAN